jgi:hypothetical protein
MVGRGRPLQQQLVQTASWCRPARVSPNACALAPDQPDSRSDARSKKLRSSGPAQPHFAQVPVLPPCHMIFHDVTCPVRLPRPTALAIVDRALVDDWRQAREQAVLLDSLAYALMGDIQAEVSASCPCARVSCFGSRARPRPRDIQLCAPVAARARARIVNIYIWCSPSQKKSH